ncbi:ABC transporter substrate-binding protein (plasmid) [Streptomyces sp. BI20]|uniref:ABC transporter substrate-binding protein n=1 Tax=Streptomyces sp. BI20 TaxID=3403460 RepID=UPI003C7656B8
MRLVHTAFRTAVVLALATAGAACAPQPEQPDAASASASAGGAGACAKGQLPTLAAGKLTIGTDKPAYAPWFEGDEPSNGKGFESAVAYAVADRLGYPGDKVAWTTVPFNSAFAPGAKTFDFDINQVSISDERKKAVDFSPGYYGVRQAVIALKDSKAANAKSLADLKTARLGAQVGTTSLEVVTQQIKPDAAPSIFQKNDFAKAALNNGQVDAIVVDLPTAFYITSAEVPEAKIIGQFEPSAATAEEFGLVLDKGSKLTSCVSAAVTELRKDGTLAALEKKWLSDAVSAPVIK